MRKITLGTKEIELRATPLALLYYRQEFGTDLMADLMSLKDMAKIEQEDFSGLDTLKLLQFVWAMSKAANIGKPFPKYEEWLGSLEQLDFTDVRWILGAIDEARDGFLHSTRPITPAKPKDKAKQS